MPNLTAGFERGRQARLLSISSLLVPSQPLAADPECPTGGPREDEWARPVAIVPKVYELSLGDNAQGYDLSGSRNHQEARVFPDSRDAVGGQKCPAGGCVSCQDV